MEASLSILPELAFGDGGVDAAGSDESTAYSTNATNANSGNIDRDASMFGIRVGKTFKNAKYSPTITLWYDRLTGNDDDNITNAEYGGFDTLLIHEAIKLMTCIE
jgi:hypothetical protein